MMRRIEGKYKNLMKGVALSVNGIPVRLTFERWNHIAENHNDMAGFYYDVLETISGPKWIFEGDGDELWAVRPVSDKKVLLVIYRESKEQNDGFIITAFITTQLKKLQKRRLIWQQPQHQ